MLFRSDIDTIVLAFKKHRYNCQLTELELEKLLNQNSTQKAKIISPTPAGDSPYDLPHVLRSREQFTTLLKTRTTDFSSFELSATQLSCLPEVRNAGYYITVFVKNVLHHKKLSQIDYCRLIESFCFLPTFAIPYCHFDPLKILEITTFAKYKQQLEKEIVYFPIVHGNQNLSSLLYSCSIIPYQSVMMNYISFPKYAIDSSNMWKTVALTSLSESHSNHPEEDIKILVNKSRCKYAATKAVKLSLPELLQSSVSTVKPVKSERELSKSLLQTQLSLFQQQMISQITKNPVVQPIGNPHSNLKSTVTKAAEDLAADLANLYGRMSLNQTEESVP